MKNSALFLVTCFSLVGLCASVGFAAAPAIGTATGNSEIVEGTQLHTASNASELNLQSGVTMHLSPRSSGTVFSDHLVLDQGSVRVGNFDGYLVDVKRLQIQTQDRATQAVVRVTNKTVEVASLGGNLRVTDGGAMLTRIAAGTRMSFRQDANSTASVNPVPTHKRLPSDEHIMVWLIGITGAAALGIGLTAAAQGKSPF